MNLMEHVSSICHARDYFREIVKLGRIGEHETSGLTFNDLPEEERLRRGHSLAEYWDGIADECEESRVTRLLFASWTPEQMRAEAAVWRTGRDPRWEPQS